jgi:hypothetical protein
MTLLREIQQAAIGPQTDITTVLRMCKVLAFRLGSSELKQWVDAELNGYTRVPDLPEYRVLDVGSLGDFSGPFGKELRNAPIPPACLPEEFRDLASKSYLTAPISSYVALINHPERRNAQENWPADLVVFWGTKIYSDMNCMSAWKVIPYNSLVAVVDTVRNRILSFVLEIQEEAPGAAEAKSGELAVSKELVSQVFSTVVMGNVQNIATGSSHVTQLAAMAVGVGDLKSLSDFLISIGVEDSDLKELEKALVTDADSGERFGRRVRNWISMMLGKASSGAWKIAVGAASSLLGQAIAKYLGLG